MRRLRALLLSDAGAALDRAALPYLRLMQRHTGVSYLVSATIIGACVFLW